VCFRRLDAEHGVSEGFAEGAVEQDAREAERLLQAAERHV
jgi:hypothetical protein